MKFKNLSRSERLILRFSMFVRGKYIRRTGLPKYLRRRIKCIFRKNHILYYLTLIKKGHIRNSVSLVITYAFIRTEENLRLLLLSLKNENSLGFYSAIRSQLELQSFLNYFLSNKNYLKEFITKNEDRSTKDDPNMVKNVLTLLNKFSKTDTRILPLYEFCSLLLHPNPSSLMEAGNIQVFGPEAGKFSHIESIDRFFEYTWHIDKNVKVDLEKWVNLICLRINDTFTVINEISKLKDDEDIKSFNWQEFIEVKNELRKKCGFTYWSRK
jgi:hypothetical protein